MPKGVCTVVGVLFGVVTLPVPPPPHPITEVVYAQRCCRLAPASGLADIDANARSKRQGHNNIVDLIAHSVECRHFEAASGTAPKGFMVGEADHAFARSAQFT
jgi:hypothetical protein